MAEFIVNPRRAPRATVRLHAAVVSSAGAFDAETEDIGPRGCQVVSPALVKMGDALEVAVTSEKLPEPLKARGKATWVSEHAPWRVGIAFDDAYVPSAERWFEKLVAATPGIGPFRRVPEKIAVEAMVYLGPPPRFLVDFSAEEAALLRAIASGARVDELMARLRRTWPAMQRALFSLLARQAVTLSRGHAAHPDAWKRILTEVEASLAVESLGASPPTPLQAPAASETTPMPVRPLASPLPPPPLGAVNPAASPWGTPARDPHPALELGEAGPSLEVGAPTTGYASGRPRDAGGAGASAQPSPQERRAEAKALYDRALKEIDGGSVNGAIALLRKALSLAPGDPDIAATLGKLAFKRQG
jgi:PilZ domain